MRACLKAGDDGLLRAHPYPAGGSGILTSMVDSDGLVEVGENLNQINEGDPVDFLPFSELCP